MSAQIRCGGEGACVSYKLISNRLFATEVEITSARTEICQLAWGTSTSEDTPRAVCQNRGARIAVIPPGHRSQPSQSFTPAVRALPTSLDHGRAGRLHLPVAANRINSMRRRVGRRAEINRAASPTQRSLTRSDINTRPARCAKRANCPEAGT